MQNDVHPIISNDLKEVCEDLKNLVEPFEESTVLVAGGTGFIGKYLVNTLLYLNEKYLSKPCSIIVVDKSSNKDEPKFISDKNLEFIEADISKPLSIERNIDFIIHSASIASPIVYRKYPLETILVNVYGTKNLLDLAKKSNVRSFLYLSSSEVYGDPHPDKIPTKEDYRGNVSSTGPRASYDESKRLAETLCMTYFRQFGLPIKIARPFNVYGPGVKPDDGRIVPDLIRDNLLKKELVLYSDGKPTRSFCYISDAIKGFFRILLSKHNGESFNIGNDEEISVLDLAKLVQKSNGGNIKFEVHPDKDYTVDNPQRRCPDLSKVKNLTGYTPIVRVSDGMDIMIRWYKHVLGVSQ